MFEADALRIMAGVFDVSYQNVYRDGLQLQGSFGADTDVISSFKVKVTTAPPELENVLQLPCDVSVDIIGSTVAVANFGNGRYIFLGLRRVFSNESRYSKSMEVWFTQEPTKTSDSYGEVEVRSMAGEHDKPSKWQFTVNANERKVIGFGQS
ncbi:hypothetical protein FB446DRAFT_718038 [Lentinula raphanica]|nr:hypothetical protein FB446DRAFT_718038 [Lentinula raphanica]